MKEPNILEDALNIYIAYVQRKLRKDPEHKPNPIARAIACALAGAEKKEWKAGQRIMGVSQDGSEGKVWDAYSVALERTGDRWQFVEMIDLQTGAVMPADLIVSFLNLQVHLDRISGDTVAPEVMVDIANKCFSSPRFVWIAPEWKQARDYFREQLEAGKLSLTEEMVKDLREKILAITYEMPWEEYDHGVRSLIGSVYMKKLFPDAKSSDAYVAITTPVGHDFEKFKVFNSLKNIFLGAGFMGRKYPGTKEFRNSTNKEKKSRKPKK